MCYVFAARDWPVGVGLFGGLQLHAAARFSGLRSLAPYESEKWDAMGPFSRCVIGELVRFALGGGAVPVGVGLRGCLFFLRRGFGVTTGDYYEGRLMNRCQDGWYR